MGDSGGVKHHFFFDNCMPRNLARTLGQFFEQQSIIHIMDDDSLKCTDEDVHIIASLARRNPKPYFISADVNMYTKVPSERQALAGSELTCVFFMKNSHTGDKHVFAHKVFKLWPNLVETVARVREPTIFEINSGLRRLDRCCLTRELHSWRKRQPDA